MWFVIVGVLLTLVALAGSVLRRLPLSATLLYLGVGLLVGPGVLGMLDVDPLSERGAPVIERLAEVAVILSLFAAGLKMRRPITDACWLLPVRLATVSMVITVGLIALAGRYGLGLPWGGAVLLGAVLAPTDPVLASDVTVERPEDEDRLRFALTGEAGFNDGTAFPFVMLGLGLLSLEFDLDLHDLGAWGWRWFAIDLLYAIPGGLAIGAVLGAATGRLVVYLRRTHHEAVGLDDFLALGLLALSYGLALVLGTWAFLAAFAAGVAMRAVERRSSPDDVEPSEMLAEAAKHAEEEHSQEMATHEEKAPAYMASAVLGFAEQLERLAAVTLVVLVGALLWRVIAEGGWWVWQALWFVPLVLLVVRPVSVWVGLLGSRCERVQKGLIAWFGIRGIGSIYYLMHAENMGLPDGVARPVLVLVLLTITVSVVVHGVSVTPVMNWYRRGRGGGGRGKGALNRQDAKAAKMRQADGQRMDAPAH